MKYSAVILLLSLLFLQTGGYYFIFCADMLAVHHEADQYRNNPSEHGDRIATLTLPVRDGKVIARDFMYTGDDEFTYQGRMYDVISSAIEGDHIVIRCYSDTHETDLNQDISSKVDSDKEAPLNKQKGDSALKVLLQLYTKDRSLAYSFGPPAHRLYRHSQNDRQQSYVFRTIISPPPEFLFL